MQLPQLLKQYNLTAQQLQTLLGKHLTLPSLRLVREVPAEWEDLLRRELGSPVEDTPIVAAAWEAVGKNRVGGGDQPRGIFADGVAAFENPAPLLVTKKSLVPALPLMAAGSPNLVVSRVPTNRQPARRPGGHEPPDARQLRIGQLVEVVEGRYGRIRPVNSMERLHLPGPALGREQLQQSAWLLFADRPNSRNPALPDIYWAAPLDEDADRLRQVLASAADPALSQLLTSELSERASQAVAAELLSRLAPADDADILLVITRTMSLVLTCCPTVPQSALRAVVAQAAPEYQWNLWLRYLSPLAGWPTAAERVVALLTDAPKAVAAWWPAAEQSGLAGLCLAYVAESAADEAPAGRWQLLQQALGEQLASTHYDALRAWVEQAGELTNPTNYLGYEQALRTTTLDGADLQQLLRAQLAPASLLATWLAGAELPFPEAAALAQFGQLSGPAQRQVAGQLSDKQLWQVAQHLAADCAEAVRHRAWRVAQAFVLQALRPFAVDVESDRTTVREVAWGWPDAWHAASGAAQVTGVLGELAAHVANGDYLAVGHNLRDFDALALAQQQVALQPENLWDTLLVELALSPLLTTYALKTAHTALADAKLTWQLFENQLWRLLQADAADWELLRALVAPATEKKLADLRHHLAGATWLPATPGELQAQVLMWLRPQPVPSALLAQVVAALADPTLPPAQLLLAAVGGWGELSIVPGLRFGGSESAEALYQELNEALVQRQLAHHPMEAVAVARFFAQCHRVGVVPTAAALPPALRTRLLAHVVLADCLVKSAPLDWSKPGCRCLTPEQLLAEADGWPTGVALTVLVAEPDLLTLNTKTLLRDKLTISDLLASEGSRTEWLKFSGGQSFVGLTREQATGLGAEVPAGYERFWLEKRRYGSFQVWGSFGWEVLLARLGSLVVRVLHSAELAFPKGQLRSLAVDASRLQQQLGVTPFHPESIYRARYWLLQAELVDSIGRRGSAPPVLLVTRPEECEAVSRYFERRGYYVPDHRAAPARQLELLHDSARERRLLVAALPQGSALLQANYRGPIELLLDGFALGENYFLAQGSPLFQQAYEQSGGHHQPDGAPPSYELAQTDEQLPGTDSADDDEPHTPVPGVAPAREYLLRDTQFLLHLHRPLVRRWQALALANHPDNRVWLLDPRLADAPGLAAAWQLQVERLPTPWPDEAAYQQAVQMAEEVLGGSRPTTDWQLDVEAAKQLLQTVFLRYEESGQVRHHPWRDEQVPYLHKILPAPANLSLLVALPTGGGKSLLFQGPALYRSAYTNRLTIVVTPLKALMEDQVANLWQRGFYSSVDYLNQDKQDEVQQLYSRLAGGELMLLFITPERFRSRGFARAFAQRLAADGGLEYAVFDEAHCISQWGHEFRPDYLHAARMVQAHRAASQHRFPVLLFSATVTEKIYDGFTTLFG